MRIMRRIALLILLTALSACASHKGIEDLSPEELYRRGYQALADTDYEKATEYFDEVEKQHPYSVWSDRAQIMAAYAAYRHNAYDDALLTLDRFIQLHPGNRNTPYAYYLKGLCYYEQMSDETREQAMTENAQETFRDLIARFPNTVYATDAQTKMDDMTNHLAAQDMEVGRYYLKRADLIPAINRFQSVLADYPDSNQVPEAYYRLAMAYQMLGVPDLARRTADTQIQKYPDDSWTHKTKSVLGL